MQNLTHQEVVDILTGVTILGTGGGGDLGEGLEAVKKAFQAGKTFQFLTFDEVEDEKLYINPYFCGSISPEEEGKEAEEHHELVDAIKGLEDYMKAAFHGVVSIEYGGGNTGQCMAAAAMLGKPIVDADAAGRAVPELQFSTYNITDQPIGPFSVATKYGDVVIFTKVASDERAEALSRMMAVATDNTVGMADHPISGENLKTSVIPGALSYAGKVGRAQREAVASGADPIEAIRAAADGKLLMTGTVKGDGTGWEIKNGFTTGTIAIEGEGTYSGVEGKIWYRNENMVYWENGEVKLTCPDLICVVNLADGSPITNPNCTEGKPVAVLAFEAHQLWKSERGKALLNPKFFGFEDQEIVPIETI